MICGLKLLPGIGINILCGSRVQEKSETIEMMVSDLHICILAGRPYIGRKF